MEIYLPQEVNMALNSLEQYGFEGYLVGGCVRDSLLDLSPQDWDLVTSAKPQQIKAIFSDYRIVEAGIKYGTITVIINEKPIEITTYRVEGMYSDNRHPDTVRFVKSLEEDLSRRDFTVNALAYHPQKGLIDYFQGLRDLQQKRIRSVGNPHERFKEDSLRIMRALRFAATYQFTIGAKTAKAMVLQKELLGNIAAERIRLELEKLLCGEGVKAVLRDYVNIIGVVIPELLPMIDFKQHNPHHHLDVWEHTLACLDKTPKEKVLRLVMLFHDIGKPLCFTMDEKGIGHFYGHNRVSLEIAKTVLKRLKYDRVTLKQVESLILYHDVLVIPETKYVKRWLNRLGEENFRLLLEVKKADAQGKNPKIVQDKLYHIEKLENIFKKVIDERQCFSLKSLAINGNDLLQLGVPQGKSLGLMLDTILKKVVNEEVENERKKLLTLAENLYADSVSEMSQIQ